MKTKFYELSQNNSGGSFVVDDKLCHRLFIEAESEEEAIDRAEDLGCYWDGVDEGSDCPCCGDRWYRSGNLVDLENTNSKWGGYEISEWLTDSKGAKGDDAIKKIKAEYGKSVWLTEPTLEKKYGSDRIVGKIKLDSIEQYAQIMANLYGWTKPDCRIFYKDGRIKNVYSKKLK